MAIISATSHNKWHHCRGKPFSSPCLISHNNSMSFICSDHLQLILLLKGKEQVYYSILRKEDWWSWTRSHTSFATRTYSRQYNSRRQAQGRQHRFCVLALWWYHSWISSVPRGLWPICFVVFVVGMMLIIKVLKAFKELWCCWDHNSQENFHFHFFRNP